MNIVETPVYQVNSTQLEWILQKILDKKFEEYIERSYRPEVIYTRDEAAKLLNVRPNTISNYIDNKILTNRGIGRKILISSKEIDRLLNKSTFRNIA
jgi:excisionase family DNA binding protein